MYQTQKYWIFPILTYVCTKHGLSMDFILQTDVDPAMGKYSEHLESWKRGMEDILAPAMKIPQ